MTETPARKPRPRRTFSAFGDVRRMPSEYEIVTHAQNWTLRQNRAAAFEQNPSSAANLWFLTYRDNTPLQATDWDAFRDPDKLTYRAYVNLQSDAAHPGLRVGLQVDVGPVGQPVRVAEGVPVRGLQRRVVPVGQEPQVGH